ncbi:MAG TPA: peptidase M28, partial [Flavobacterium sp.]|nr:peptidase M28 [Flavobacterium sp.]
LDLQFSIGAKGVLDMELMESSFNLMSDRSFKIARRQGWMMPTPFVLNDAVIIKQKLKANFKEVPAPVLDSIQQQTLNLPADAAD